MEAIVDQRLLAGIGNVYRSETLFLCGIHPLRPAGRVTSDEARAIGTTAASLRAAGAATCGPIRTSRSPEPRSCGRAWVDVDCLKERDAIIQAIKDGRARIGYQWTAHQSVWTGRGGRNCG